MTDLSRIREVPHRRFNPLTRDWVLVSPHRTQRPWQGQTEREPEERELRYDPHCYLCPGNERAGGARNPQYDSTFVFDNDFAALRPDVPKVDVSNDGKSLLIAEAEPGVCRVVCFSPRHDMTVARMEVAEICKVVDLWTEQYRELGAMPEINHVQIFENRGEMMGCSNPHPHGQIWANNTIPNVPRLEQASLIEYRRLNQSCLLCDYVELERAAGERIVCELPGHRPALGPALSGSACSNSHFRTSSHIRCIVRSFIPSASAASSSVSPRKYFSSTSVHHSGFVAASRSSSRSTVIAKSTLEPRAGRRF